MVAICDLLEQQWTETVMCIWYWFVEAAATLNVRGISSAVCATECLGGTSLTAGLYFGECDA